MLNKVILIGNLGKDPEIRYTQAGAAVANVSLATTETWTKDGTKEETTEWHKLVAFGKVAEIIGEYLKKGSKVYIEGKIQTRKWQDKDGNDKYTTEIVVREMKMLGGGEPRADRQPEGERQNKHYSKPEPNETHDPSETPMGSDVPF